MIKVRFKVIEEKDQIAVIQNFLSSDGVMSRKIADFFGLDLSLDQRGRKRQSERILSELYTQRLSDMQKACEHFQKVWDEKEEEINQELTKIFGREFDFECDAYVNLNPVWPRYLEERCFDVNVDSSDDFLLSSATHELAHFAWFEVWKENFPHIHKTDYDFPNISWLISEIAIEPIFRFSKLKDLSQTNPAYDYFYTEKIAGQTVAQIANKLFSESKDIKEFQTKMYDFFNNNAESRKLIR